jgi:hypothetical protein
MEIVYKIGFAPSPNTLLSLSMDSLPISKPVLNKPKHAPEGGKLILAEEFFNRYKFQIRCTGCLELDNPHNPGFIKDQAGKTTLNGSSHRQWACQRSNGRGATNRCARVSCSGYIELARAQLKAEDFEAVVRRICRHYPPGREEYAGLQFYLPRPEPESTPPQPTYNPRPEAKSTPTRQTPSPRPEATTTPTRQTYNPRPNPKSTPIRQTPKPRPEATTTPTRPAYNPRPEAKSTPIPISPAKAISKPQMPKRRANESLEASKSKRPCIAKHLSRKELVQAIKLTQMTVEPLTLLVELSEEWKKQLDQIERFLATVPVSLLSTSDMFYEDSVEGEQERSSEPAECSMKWRGKPVVPSSHSDEWLSPSPKKASQKEKSQGMIGGEGLKDTKRFAQLRAAAREIHGPRVTKAEARPSSIESPSPEQKAQTIQRKQTFWNATPEERPQEEKSLAMIDREGMKQAQRFAQAAAGANRFCAPKVTKAESGLSSIETSSPDRKIRAKQLVQKFRDANKEERRPIREEARQLGVYGLFQSLLKKNSLELKCSEAK